MTDFLETLNEQQREAVTFTDGPLLILAGAGSGKTRVLTCRVAWLIAQGVDPWHILAITFTNKAADEMRERVNRLLPGSGSHVFVSTFHSLCVRILRSDIDRLGYERDFTVYDTDDQRTLVKSIIKGMNLDTASYRDRAVLSMISSSKNDMIDAELFEENAGDYYERIVAKIYKEYQRQLKKNNALDFDDLLLMTVELFNSFPDVLEKWRERFRYIMVDEYQDTNMVQFEMVRLMAGKERQLCVVGDDDQSIYRFRGADIENILSFEKSFPGCRTIKLEQNYRSTKAILKAANAVIRNNAGRKDKTLWTENEEGDLPVYREYESAPKEAEAVIREVRDAAADGRFTLGQQAVLYRTNAQSRLLEEQCVAKNVPYLVVGGVNFYQRKEIKDILSYLRIVANGVDDLSCERILNVPRRGIGATSAQRIRTYASVNGLSFYDALKKAGEIPGMGAAAKKIKGFTELIDGFRAMCEEPDFSLRILIESVRDDTGYLEELAKEEDPVQAKTREENIEELISKAVSFQEEETEMKGAALLSAFLEDVALVADVDRMNDGDDVLTLMTLHGAKGLEFPKVFLCGMEDGLFPSSMAINSSDPEREIEEERRLCYVGMTRAQKELVMTSARERMVNGETRYAKPSRFIDEIPEECAVKQYKSRRSGFDFGDDDGLSFGGRRSFGGGSYGGDAYGDGYGGRSSYGSGSTYGGGRFREGAYGHYEKPDAPVRLAQGMLGFGSLDKPAGSRYASGKKTSLSGISKGSAHVKEKPEYGPGDRVRHVKFGEGEVLEVSEGERDYEVRVLFDTAGEKRMFAGFAKLQKI